MGETITTSLSISKVLYDQAEILAQRLEISQNDLIELALEIFINNHKNPILPDELNKTDQTSPEPTPAIAGGKSPVLVNQGDIYWVLSEAVNGEESGIRHPHVVIQDNVFNHSRIKTVVACALTSNIKRASLPGNVLLDVGEANLIRQSVVEVSKVSTIDKMYLGDYIGALSVQRINQILAGMRFLQLSFFAR